MADVGDTLKKHGYLRGVHGVMITPIDPDTGEVDAEKAPQWVNTAQQVSAEAEYEDGDRDSLRGGDRVLVHVEEDDTLVAIAATFRNARFHPVVEEYVDGGPLIYSEEVGEETIIVGYDDPTIEEQATGRPAFRAEIYVKNFNSSGKRDDYMKLTLHYCKGQLGSVSFEDQTWSTPEFAIRATGHPDDGKIRRREFVAAGDVPTSPTHDPE